MNPIPGRRMNIGACQQPAKEPMTVHCSRLNAPAAGTAPELQTGLKRHKS